MATRRTIFVHLTHRPCLGLLPGSTGHLALPVVLPLQVCPRNPRTKDGFTGNIGERLSVSFMAFQYLFLDIFGSCALVSILEPMLVISRRIR